MSGGIVKVQSFAEMAEILKQIRIFAVQKNLKTLNKQ
jgi:hypothetical protein